MAYSGRIFDIHTHFYPDDIAEYVLGRYRMKTTIACAGTKSATLEQEKAAGIARFNVLPVATTPSADSTNAFAVASADHTVTAFGTVHPQAPAPEAVMERFARQGLRGVKIHPQFQSTDIDSEAYKPIFRAAAACGLPVLFHAGLDSVIGGPVRAMPEAISRLLDWAEAVPGLVLIAAHMGGMSCFDDVEKYIVGRRIYLDTALVAGTLPREQYRRIIEHHGYGQILFGSDCPWQSPAAALSEFRALELDDAAERAILWDNAASLLRLPD